MPGSAHVVRLVSELGLKPLFGWIGGGRVSSSAVSIRVKVGVNAIPVVSGWGMLI